MLVPASSSVVAIVVCIVGVLAYMQMRRNDMHAAMGVVVHKPVDEALAYLHKQGYSTRVTYIDEPFSRKPWNIDIELEVDRETGTVAGIGTD